MRTLLIFIALARTSAACSCGSEALSPICKRISEVDVLFIGTPVATNDKYGGPAGDPVWYRFSVQEVFKGLQPQQKEVLIDTSTPCAIQFTVGKQYLVFSYRQTAQTDRTSAVSEGLLGPRRPVLVTGSCSGSHEVQYVSARDLQFARQYRAAPGPPSIVGSARIHADEFQWSDRYPPLAGASIKLSGFGAVRTATTGPDGTHEFPNVPPGNYLVTAYAKGFVSSSHSYDVAVPAQGCGLANIGMFTDGGMRGKVLEHNGRPARYVTVEYLHADPALKDSNAYPRAVKTNDQGEFRFVGVPPGDFLLGVRIDSAPTPEEGIVPAYWPGVTDRGKAQILRMAAGEKRDNLVLRLGPRAATRLVSIELRRADGRPQAGATVWASVNGGSAGSATTNGAGVAKLSVLAGVSYSFSARAQLGNPADSDWGWVDTEPAILSPGTFPAQVVVVFKKPGKRND